MRPTQKNKHLNRWLWRWHIIAGLITLPIILLLTITGIVYLFKADINEANYRNITHITPQANTTRLSYADQLAIAESLTQRTMSHLFLQNDNNKATAFKIKTKGHAREMVYVDPYSGIVTGTIDQKQTLMYTVRKLHGELLLNKPGTLVVELVASWFLVLIITGLYVWWPARRFSTSGFFTLRTKQGKKIFWRDNHAVIGFWLSAFMLIILAGGMPWTDVFGSSLKWVQKHTNTGYPNTWRNASGLTSNPQTHTTTHLKPQTEKRAIALSIDQLVDIAQQKNLKGELSITLPQSPEQVATLSNRSFWLADQVVIHIDQYSGEVIKSHTWEDVGILMEARQVAMRLHQGEYGAASWWAVFLIGLIFTLSCLAGLISYLIRKPRGRWGLPKVPDNFQADRGILALLLLLAIIFPLFGASVILITLGEWLIKRRQITHESINNTL